MFRCRTIFYCTDACPRGIEVTRAIQEVKRAIMFEPKNAWLGEVSDLVE